MAGRFTMPERAFEIHSRRITELIDKLEQIGLNSREVVKIVKALNSVDGNNDIIPWFNSRRDRALNTMLVHLAGVFVLFIGIMGMMASANGVPTGNFGLSAFISSASLLTCCIISALYYLSKANSIDHRLEQILPVLDSYRKSP